MTYCTVVEFEWSDPAERGALEGAAGGGPTPGGCLSRILRIDDDGARIIEVWASSDAARAHAARSAAATSSTAMPAPTPVFGFEVTDYLVS